MVWYSGRVKQTERRSNLIYALSCFTLPSLSSSFAPSSSLLLLLRLGVVCARPVSVCACVGRRHHRLLCT